MKTSKRVLSVLLSLVLLLSVAVLPVSALDATEACPQIYVHGFMGSTLLEDRDDPNSKVIWPPDANALIADVQDALPTLVSALLVNNWETFGTVAIDLVNPYFEPTYLADDGTCQNNSGVYFPFTYE